MNESVIRAVAAEEREAIARRNHDALIAKLAEALEEREYELGALRSVYRELTGKDWRWEMRRDREEGE